jgi:SAM-dependent methyltransferase
VADPVEPAVTSRVVDLEPLLRCPQCGSRVAFEASAVRCPDGHVYPVVDGVPRLVGHPWTPGDAELVAATGEAFGRQWTELGEAARVTLADLALHLPTGWGLSTFSGLVLDAGCGIGRYTALAAQLGAEAVGIDVGSSVTRAARLWPGPAFVQADLAAPPFAPRTFDTVFCFGVLHHLPDPARGLEACFDLVRPNGVVLAWVYSERRSVPRRVRRRARALVRRFPRLVSPLSWAAALVLLALCRLQRSPGLRFYADKGLRQVRVDAHDALIAPREQYMTASDCRSLLEHIDAARSGVELRRDGSGWLLWARRRG